MISLLTTLTERDAQAARASDFWKLGWIICKALMFACRNVVMILPLLLVARNLIWILNLHSRVQQYLSVGEFGLLLSILPSLAVVAFILLTFRAALHISFSIFAKWVLVGKIRPHKYELYTWVALKHDFVATCFDACTNYFVESQLQVWFLRLHGVRIGKNVTIGAALRFGGLSNLTFSRAFDLIEIGDNTVIDPFVSFVPAESNTGWEYVVKPIKIGADCHIANGACLLPGTTVGNHSVVAPMAAVRAQVPSDSFFSARGETIDKAAAEKEKKLPPHIVLRPKDPHTLSFTFAQLFLVLAYAAQLGLAISIGILFMIGIAAKIEAVQWLFLSYSSGGVAGEAVIGAELLQINEEAPMSHATRRALQSLLQITFSTPVAAAATDAARAVASSAAAAAPAAALAAVGVVSQLANGTSSEWMADPTTILVAPPQTQTPPTPPSTLHPSPPPDPPDR